MTVSVETNKSILLTYNYDGGTTTYSWGSFDVPSDSDVEVYAVYPSDAGDAVATAGQGDRTLLTLTTHYTVSTGSKEITITAAGDTLISGNAAYVSDATTRLVVYRRIAALTQTREYNNQGAFLSAAIEASFDAIYYVLQQHEERLDRTIQIDPWDTVLDGLSESARLAAVRLNNLSAGADGVIYWDAATSTMRVSSDVSTSDVSAVADNISAIVAVNANSTNINAVNANSTNINTVAGISANVTTVAGISADVTAVAGNSSDITTVATNIANVNTTATNISNVNAVGASIANVNTVAGNTANINTVAGNTANINTVAGNTADIDLVSSNTANIIVVAADLSGDDDIGTVANSIVNVDAVATNINDITNGFSQAAAGVQRTSYTGDNSTTTFALPSTPWSSAVVFAYLDGVNQDDANWSVTGSNIIFGTAPGTGVNIELVVLTAGTVTAAETAATDAQTAAAAAQAALDAFEATYLGAQASDPSVDLNGSPVTAGDWYFNTTSNRSRIYDGSNWTDASALAASADETITGAWAFDGGLDIQGKWVVVESPGSGVDAVSAIHAARDTVGVGGTIMLAAGQDYEIASDLAMNVAGQTLFIPAGASITSQTPASGDAIRVTADDCTIMGSGELVSVSINAGDYAAVGAAEGFCIFGQGFTIKNPLSRAVNIVDSYGDKPVEIIGVRVYWDAGGVVNSKALLPLLFNIETYDATAVGDNLLVRDCEVDYSAWTQEDLAEILYPLGSGAPNTIGFRISANNNTIWKKARVENCRGIMPLATQGSASWDPVTYGNAADGVGQRRPTIFEITADRSTLNYTGKTGAFSTGETVTGSDSGAQCIVDTEGSTSFTFYSRSGAFEPGETITGGTSAATATFASEQGNFQDLQFVNNKAIGGDLGFSMGGIGKCLFTGNFAEGQTSYPLEFASSSIITGSGNHYGGYQAGKTLSCTNTTIVNLSGEYVEAGANTDFGDANTGVTFEGVGRLNLSGVVKAGADNISLVKIRTAGGVAPEINLSGLMFLGEEFSTLKAIHVDQGTVNSLIVDGCTFRDIDTNSLVVDSGTTVTNLVTTNNVGENAAAFANNGTITNHINSGNIGISGFGSVATNVSNPQAPVHVAAASAHAYLEETDAGVDAKVWVLQAQNEVLSVQARTDAYAFSSTLMRLNRSGQFEQPSGSVSAPAYAFQSDLDTGWYSPGADQAALATGGTDAISVDASQVVSFPGGGVDINSGSIDGAAIGASSRANGYFSGFGVGTSSPSGTAEIKSSGNATFNLTSSFSGSTSNGFYVNCTGDTAISRFAFTKWNGSSYVTRGGLFFRHAASGNDEKFTVNVAGGADKLVVEGAGHVGLNNATPAYACDVGGDANVTGEYRVDATTVIDTDRLYLCRSYTVATAPSASGKGAGAIIYVTDGDAGADCLAQSDGTNWMRIAHGAAISAT